MIPESIAAQCARNDAALAAIAATVTRLEQRSAREQRDLLRVVAERAAVDPAFRGALIMLILD